MSIVFEKVSKSFGPKVVLKDFSLEVPDGEILFILGRSGVGKSVTLKQLVGLLKPDQGRIWIDGENVAAMGEQELFRIRRKCGMVFQHPALFDSLTIFDNIAFGLQDLMREDMRSCVLRALKNVHLDEKILSKKPHEISYGMQKRVSLARTLAPGPKTLLFDEPTTGLDPITTRAVNDLIRELSDKLKVTSIVVSHDMECALQVAHRILVLDDAKILALGSPEEMRKSKEPLVRGFLSEVLA